MIWTVREEQGPKGEMGWPPNGPGGGEAGAMLKFPRERMSKLQYERCIEIGWEQRNGLHGERIF